ncbi:hypothetical protein M1V68_25595, partial [Klebsiella pneumoniae]|nr:hypothetical protein [Klebsiella pneumoniae]
PEVESYFQATASNRAKQLNRMSAREFEEFEFFPHAGLNKPPILARLTRSLQRRNAKIENRLDDFHRFPNNECVLTHNQVIS